MSKKPMTAKTLVAVTAALTLSLAASAGAQDVHKLFDEALAPAGLSTTNARLDSGLLTMFRQGEFTTPFYSAINTNPWDLHRFGEARLKESLTAANKPSALFNQTASLLGFGTRRTLVSNPIQYALDFGKRPGALSAVLETMRKNGQIKGKVPSLSGLPEPVQQAAASILTVCVKSVELRRLAFADIPDTRRLFKLVARGIVEDSDYTTQLELNRSFRKLNLNYMSAVSHDIALVSESVVPMVQSVSPNVRYSWRVRTSWGLLRFSGGGNDGYDDEPSLITIDTGGDDVYLNGPSNTSIDNWASVVIDTDGNDNYLSDKELRSTTVASYRSRKSGDRPGPAGAVMGVALLIDSKGNDTYRTHRPGLGSGKLGFAGLLDMEGNDVYDAYEDSEGFGQMGVGVSSDLSGDDKYTGFHHVQGVGLSNGGGLCLDVQGTDSYIANDEQLDFPSAQTTQHNISMSQGAGEGRRADYLDGLSYAGGVGILADGGGNDTYSCGVFGQGVGYWMGTGMLLDANGSDSYNGQWYCQGASAHMATGFLGDFGGNDTYVAGMNMAQGAGHDFGVGALFDRSGDDTHRAPNLSLGAGNANGIGWFVDLAGSDKYTADGMVLGRAAESTPGTLREFGLCLGVFVDAGGGNDNYSSLAEYAQNNQKNVLKRGEETDPTRSQVGCFLDK